MKLLVLFCLLRGATTPAFLGFLPHSLQPFALSNILDNNAGFDTGVCDRLPAFCPYDLRFSSAQAIRTVDGRNPPLRSHGLKPLLVFGESNHSRVSWVSERCEMDFATIHGQMLLAWLTGSGALGLLSATRKLPISYHPRHFGPFATRLDHPRHRLQGSLKVPTLNPRLRSRRAAQRVAGVWVGQTGSCFNQNQGPLKLVRHIHTKRNTGKQHSAFHWFVT